MKSQMIRPCEMRLADTVAFIFREDGQPSAHADGSRMIFGDCTVHQIKDGYVHLVRPYVKTEDFSGTFGVLWSIGIENIRIPVSQDIHFALLARKELK